MFSLAIALLIAFLLGCFALFGIASAMVRKWGDKLAYLALSAAAFLSAISLVGVA